MFGFGWLRKIIGRGESERESFDSSLFVVHGDGLNRWGIEDGTEIEVELFNNIDECYSVDVETVVADKNGELKMFIDYFDVRPMESEAIVAEYKKVVSENDPNVFIGELSVPDLYGWELYYAMHFREFQDLSRCLWSQLCRNVEKRVFDSGEWKDYDYHRLAIVALKYGNNATTYEIVPAEFLIGKEIKERTI